MIDRAVTMVLCGGLGLLGGFIGGIAILVVYLIGVLCLGVHVSEMMPMLVERITVPLGILIGLFIGAVTG